MRPLVPLAALQLVVVSPQREAGLRHEVGGRDGRRPRAHEVHEHLVGHQFVQLAPLAVEPVEHACGQVLHERMVGVRLPGVVRLGRVGRVGVRAN